MRFTLSSWSFLYNNTSTARPSLSLTNLFQKLNPIKFNIGNRVLPNLLMSCKATEEELAFSDETDPKRMIPSPA